MLTDEEIEIFMTPIVKFDDMSVDELKEEFMKMMKRAKDGIVPDVKQREYDMKLMSVLYDKDINVVDWYKDAKETCV